jgi:hypothetical protein
MYACICVYVVCIAMIIVSMHVCMFSVCMQVCAFVFMNVCVAFLDMVHVKPELILSKSLNKKVVRIELTKIWRDQYMCIFSFF